MNEINEINEINDLSLDENKLDQYIQNVKKDNIVVPAELEQRVNARISKLKQPTSVFKYVIAASFAFCLMMAVMIRFSPVVASYAAEIPGLAPAVAWLRGDSGIRNAREHGYGGVSPITIERDGFIIKIDDIFFDEDRLRFSAIVSGPGIAIRLPAKRDDNKAEQINETDPFKYRNADMHLDFDFKDFNDGGYVMSSNGQSGEFLAYDVEKSFNPGETAAFLDKASSAFNISLRIKKGNEEVFAVENMQLPFDSTKFISSKVYKQNRHVVLKHTEIYIDNLIISPTRMKLYIGLNMEDGYFLTGFENPHLKDDKGNIYKGEGVILRDSGPDERILYFVPSTYFDKQPEKLYFCFDGIRIGCEEGKSFTLSLEEKFPKKLLYMGKEISITDVAWHEAGKLIVKFEYPDDGTLRIQGLNITGNEVKASGWQNSVRPPDTQGGSSIFENICDFEIEKRPIYNMEFEFPGYLIPSGMDIEMALQK